MLQFFYKGQIYINPPYYDEYFKQLTLKEEREYKLNRLNLKEIID